MDSFVDIEETSGSLLAEYDSMHRLLETYVDKRWITPSLVCSVLNQSITNLIANVNTKNNEFWNRNAEKISTLPRVTESDLHPFKPDEFLKDGSFSSISRAQTYGDPQSPPQLPATADIPKDSVLDHLNEIPLDCGSMSNIFLQSHQDLSHFLPLLGVENATQDRKEDVVRMYLNEDPYLENQQPTSIIKQQQEENNSLSDSGTPLMSSPQMSLPTDKTGKDGERLGTILELARTIVNADYATIFLHDAYSNELFAHAASPEPINISIPTFAGIAGSCFTTGKTINCPLAYQDSRFFAGIDRRTRTPTHSILAVPIVLDNGKTAGVLEVLNKKKRESFSVQNEQDLKVVSKMLTKVLVEANKGTEPSPKKGNKRSSPHPTGQPPAKKSRGRPKDKIWQTMEPRKA